MKEVIKMMNKVVEEMNKMAMVEAENRGEYVYIMVWDESNDLEEDEYWEEIDKINEIIREANRNGIRVRSYWESEDE